MARDMYTALGPEDVRYAIKGQVIRDLGGIPEATLRPAVLLQSIRVARELEPPRTTMEVMNAALPTILQAAGIETRSL